MIIKTCNCCKRSYTMMQWIALPRAIGGSDIDFGNIEVRK